MRPEYCEVQNALLLQRGAFEARVDICVPLFRSQNVFPLLAASLKRVQEPFNLLCVVDGDSYDPRPAIAKEIPEGISVRVVSLDQNTGFAHASNLAARMGRAPYLLFLNADVVVRPGFLKPLMEELDSDDEVLAAGGLQLRQGLIHSCGSEYDWRTKCFEHCFKDSSPGIEEDYVRLPGDRDMMTASCLLLKRRAFEDVGGFDEAYRIGYWEDTDLCMKLRRKGGRIRYTPRSVVEHNCNHSGAAGHEFYNANQQLFHKRWVDNGMVDRFARARGRQTLGGKVVVGMIVLNEEEYIGASLKSIYEAADRIIIVEGGNPTAKALGLTNANGGSIDKTVERINAFPDPQNKLTLIQGFWTDKTPQRNAYINYLSEGDILLMLDADEVMFADELWRVLFLMHYNEAVNFPMLTFWNNFSTMVTGVWEIFRPAKCVRWRSGTHYAHHTRLVRADGTPVGQLDDPGTLRLERPAAAHYAYVKPLWKLRRKIEYYDKTTNSVQPDYFEKVFLGFRDNPEVIKQFGSHPFGGGEVYRFDDTHPEPISQCLANGELGGGEW